MKMLLVALFAIFALASNSFAALSAADQTAIQNGITASDSVFYAIGGTVLVVMAGIWGFKRVKALLGS